MELEQAIKIVEHYQKWRKGENETLLYTPKELSEAIDEILETANFFNSMGKFTKLLQTPTTSPNP
jgi:CRISPR/Cas system CSM-associated protein Csm2 small subunit